jgi:tetratricopeptide (TPR) repeat protein
VFGKGRAVNEPEAISSEDRRSTAPVFISYATADRKQALSACKAIESRGLACWISSRDVAPGENYQEAIVRAIRIAPAMVLLFSSAANNSDEIKKELSLASRFRVPVIALRIEEVEPSDAFAYELSTRQWIDAFDSWDKSIDALVSRVAQMSGEESTAVSTPVGVAAISRRALTILATLLLVLASAGGLWWWLRPAPAAAHSMVVRLNGFQLLSPGLPSGMPESVDSEIAAAFNAAGVVGVSTASAPAPGTAPAYALGGTIQRDGDTIRVISRLTNERSGATLWTDTFNYDANEAGKVPRHIAVDAGNVVRCGLFGASTYRKPLPDAVLNDYMQFCQGHWDPNLREGRKALVPAQRVVAAVPDFSWGWAAVAGGYWKIAINAESDQLADQARASGRDAADRAIALDGNNSEALYIKAVLVDGQDWLARDALFKRALAARRLDCGCEYHQYGWMLVDAGRVAEGIEKLRRANDMLALYVYTPLTLANALIAGGQLQEAKTYFDAAIELAPDEAFATWLRMYEATSTEDAKSLLNPDLPLSPELRAALLKAIHAKSSADANAKADAVQSLLALPEKQQRDDVAILLAELGANHDAFQLAARLAKEDYHGPSLFWYKSTRGILNDPGFPALARELGLINYWKTTHTRPDACAEHAPPSFCQLI